MSFLRVSNPSAVVAVDLFDLGVSIAISATNIVLSDQFSIQDLVRSADLEAAIIAGDLTVQIDYGTGFTAVAASDYSNRDALGTFLNIYEITNENTNERLVSGADASSGTSLHNHNSIYFTETELGGTGGAALIGVNQTNFQQISGATVQAALDSIDDAFVTLVTLDSAYDNDSDGILLVDGTTKDLNFRSNNANDVAISRISGADIQDFLRADVSADELILGSAAVGALALVNVRIKKNLIVEGDITFTGTMTDTTVSELNVTNANIKLREGAATGADAQIEVERGSTGTDATVKWDETADRWKAGLEGSEQTIALLEADETISGTWLFDPTPATDPNFVLDERAAPTTGLGAAGQVPVFMAADGTLAVYDKSNSRNKALSVARKSLVFTGRSNNNNKDEYLYIGQINSFETGLRLEKNMTLVAGSAQTQASGTYTIRIRKNGSATNLASIVVTAATGAHVSNLNLDLDAGDRLQAYIENATGVASPVVRLEMAERIA